jgi:uncharacterized protein
MAIDLDGHPWEIAHNSGWTVADDGAVTLAQAIRLGTAAGVRAAAPATARPGACGCPSGQRVPAPGGARSNEGAPCCHHGGMPMLTDDMKRVIREQTLGFVATVCPDGTPNLSPKGTTTVWDDDHLVFADLASPGTMGNLRQNPSVEINVVDPVTRTGYRFKGRAEIHTRGSVFDEVVDFSRIDRRLAPPRVRGVAIVTVEETAPLVSPAYDAGLSRREIVERSLRRFERTYGIRIVGQDGTDPGS